MVPVPDGANIVTLYRNNSPVTWLGVEFYLLMLLLLVAVAIVPLLYSLNLPPVGQHDHSLTLIHLQALGFLDYRSHPPTLPFIVGILYDLFGPDYRIIRLLAILSASLIPVSSYLMGSRYGKKVGITSYVLTVFTPLYLIYGKAPLYALFGFSLGSLALALFLSGRGWCAHAMASVSLLADWTSLPFVLPILPDIRRRWVYGLPYLPTTVVYTLWLKNFSSTAGTELLQRIPTAGDVLMLVPVLFLNLLLFIGPIRTFALFGTVKRSNIPESLIYPLVIQMVFVLLWADFYVHHVPYMFNLLPFVSVILASGVLRHRRYLTLLTVAALLYVLPFTYASLYPYRLFEASTVGCLLTHLSRGKVGVRIEIPEDGPPESLKTVLTMVYPDPSSPISLSYIPEDTSSYVLFGDTVVLRGTGHLRERCKTGDTLLIDDLIIKWRESARKMRLTGTILR